MSALIYSELCADEQARANAPADERLPGPWRVPDLDAKLADARERMRRFGIVELSETGRWPQRRVKR